MQTKANHTQQLYVIPAGGGYSCLGFIVCIERYNRLMAWLRLPPDDLVPGSLEAYAAYESVMDQARQRCKKTNERCPVDLTPELVGLEGKRVEVTAPDGTKNRFYVGKSTGWIPCHLEIKRRDSSGGVAVCFPPGSSIRVVKGTR